MARLNDGAKTTISLAGATLFPTGITIPSFEGGGGIDTTTLKNTTMRTRMPRVLKDVGECSFTAAYDPAALATLYGNINADPSEITITFADSGTVKFYGFVDSVAPGELTEGELPTVDVTVIAANTDATSSADGTEKAPTFA